MVEYDDREGAPMEETNSAQVTCAGLVTEIRKRSDHKRHDRKVSHESERAEK